jgi:hypothetical protein
MKHAVLTIALVTAITPLGAQTSRRPGPTRIAVGMRNGDQMTPITVEATNTGWVTINFLSTSPDAGVKIPAMRMMAEARDVHRWAARGRAFLSTVDDTTTFVSHPEIIQLGNGRYFIGVSRSFSGPQKGREREVYFFAQGCGPGRHDGRGRTRVDRVPARNERHAREGGARVDRRVEIHSGRDRRYARAADRADADLVWSERAGEHFAHVSCRSDRGRLGSSHQHARRRRRHAAGMV